MDEASLDEEAAPEELMSNSLKVALPLGAMLVAVVIASVVLAVQRPFGGDGNAGPLTAPAADTAENDATATPATLAENAAAPGGASPDGTGVQRSQESPAPDAGADPAPGAAAGGTRPAAAPVASGPPAAEIEGIANWINSEPLTMAGLRGKVVLVDFWTYTCINCLRTLPFLKLWDAKYLDDGLVILGVHTPEFEFEKDFDNVAQATRDNGVGWPVAQDNDYVTWNNYSNRYWPAKYLVDQSGVVRYTHFGEGAYAETESQIRQLLEEAGADLSDDAPALLNDHAVDPEYLRRGEVTRELYTGQERNFGDALYGRGGYVRQREYFENTDTVVDFTAPEELKELKPHNLYFNGPWFVGKESVRHARTTDHQDDYLDLVYSARSVNVVLTSESGEPYKVRVTTDGEFLTEENKGPDVIIGEDGESFINVTGPKMYRIVNNPGYAWREHLRMTSTSDDFGVFAFTFGVYQEGQ